MARRKKNDNNDKPAPSVDPSERHLSLAWQEEQNSARWEHNYGGSDPFDREFDGDFGE